MSAIETEYEQLIARAEKAIQEIKNNFDVLTPGHIPHTCKGCGKVFGLSEQTNGEIYCCLTCFSESLTRNNRNAA